MLREGRFGREMDPKALKFSSSIDHDLNIFYYDILVDLAHTLNLFKSGYLSREEALKIIKALKEIQKQGYQKWDKYEDIHEAIEAEITQRTPAGKKLHTGRSRNDEVATCLRLFARDHLLDLAEKLIYLQEIILKVAENDAIMPGFTHFQFAQPTRLSHHLLTFFEIFERDFQRALETFKRVNKCPLGASAFAGTSYKLDREFTAKILGFDGILEHSEDAVASRDFLIESVYVCTLVLLNVSRVCEEIILFATLGFVDLPSGYSSTSSIMPQKKNPDIAELLRANCGKLIGLLTSAMTIYKALPFSYNRDFQEMNPILYKALKETINALEVLTGMISEIKFKKEAMEQKAMEGFTTATELADLLVKDFRIPFRDAHRIIARLASEGNYNPSSEHIERIAKELGYEIIIPKEKIAEVMKIENIVESRKTIGGTAKEEVERMKFMRKEKVLSEKRELRKIRSRIKNALELIRVEIKNLGGNFDADW
ncbi:MAG: argininosuccinate lyase [Archaeoglobaceae archaeon]|nr:argininosuccinate lyase [Archaeoglobaceae archaeon]MDW8117472.1 argininosuccinate lyase [Archaeoglobaceae archaeon]